MVAFFTVRSAVQLDKRSVDSRISSLNPPLADSRQALARVRKRAPRGLARTRNGRRVLQSPQPSSSLTRISAPKKSTPYCLGSDQAINSNGFTHQLLELHASADIAAKSGEDQLQKTLPHSPQAPVTSSSKITGVAVIKLHADNTDPSPLHRRQTKQSLRHTLTQQEPALRAGLRLKIPKIPMDAEMLAIMPIIDRAFERQPTGVVPLGEPFSVDTVGHFWQVDDFVDLPPELFEIMVEMHAEETREIAHVRQHGVCSGFNLQGDGARKLGIPEPIVQDWAKGAKIPLSEDPKSSYRRPYSSVYQTLQNLVMTCKESLRLQKLGKVMPWLRRPWLVSATAMILKASIFEPDGIKKRICYDMSASGLNGVIDIPESSLPTIFSLLEAMGPGYFMAKSDLKDMFLNFPISDSQWTLLGFTHPVSAQYQVIPFFPFGLANAPGDCQRYAEAVRDVINDEAQRRIDGRPSILGLTDLPRHKEGLAAAFSSSDASTEVYIDNFQHLTRLLQQGLEIFEIGERVFEIIGLVEKITKREGPARVMTLLGFNVDSTTNLLSIPSLKCDEMLALIDAVLDMAAKGGAVPFSTLLSLHGKLMWASTGIELGRSQLAAIRRPLDAVSENLKTKVHRASFLIPVADFHELLKELKWWRAALSAGGRSVLLHVGQSGLYERFRWQGTFGDHVDFTILQVFTDACMTGGGWSWAQERMAFTWSKGESKHHINILEAQTVLRLLTTDATSFAGCRVLLWCDNSVTVKAIRKGTSSSPILRDIIRAVRTICLRYHISLWPVHIAGALNVLADRLSRGLVSARSGSWSFNTAIMARWRAWAGGSFDVDAFADPSGRGAQADVFHSAVDPPFGRHFDNKTVFAFPPLALVDKFLAEAPSWRARYILAVLPVKLMELATCDAVCLHSYGSHYGIFSRPDGSKTMPCAAIGYSMGVYLLK